ncbi:hypothetical protein GCM10010201_08300 [Pilimelia columellifera subsp. columellifera]|uniref:Uncharacterized protein n=1 Tax=Pilimelia columellifera subsp. columellifera TaxID=706583 RepID=A0ABN3N926_9ACTN
MIRHALRATIALGLTAAVFGTVSAAAAAPGSPAASERSSLGAFKPAALSDHDAALVRFIAFKDPYPLVRRTAYHAFAYDSPTVPLVRRFIDKDFSLALEQAQATEQRDEAFIDQILRMHDDATSPHVMTEARRARASSLPDVKARFVADGYAKARLADRRIRESEGKHVAALKKFDRDYVLMLSDRAPGKQVKISAAWATRVGSTDADIVEFYAFTWASASRMDLDQHRIDYFHREMAWRRSIAALADEALVAQRKAENASAETEHALRQAAVDAWGAVAGQTTPARVAWVDARKVAEEQAALWATVLADAKRFGGPNWGAVTDPATKSVEEWDEEITAANERAAYWNGVLRQAQAAADAVRPKAPRSAG